MTFTTHATQALQGDSRRTYITKKDFIIYNNIQQQPKPFIGFDLNVSTIALRKSKTTRTSAKKHDFNRLTLLTYNNCMNLRKARRRVRERNRIVNGFCYARVAAKYIEPKNSVHWRCRSSGSRTILRSARDIPSFSLSRWSVYESIKDDPDAKEGAMPKRIRFQRSCQFPDAREWCCRCVICISFVCIDFKLNYATSNGKHTMRIISK